MSKDTKLLIKLTFIAVLIATVALSYKDIRYSFAYSRMTKAEKIHELHKLGIPTEEESKMEMKQ